MEGSETHNHSKHVRPRRDASKQCLNKMHGPENAHTGAKKAPGGALARSSLLELQPRRIVAVHKAQCWKKREATRRPLQLQLKLEGYGGCVTNSDF